MTFEHLWGSFIDTLKFQASYTDRRQTISRYQILRNEYINIFQKVGIKQFFITTHAYYEIEDITDVETFHRLTFENIIQVAKEKDKLTIFDFKDILDADDSTQLDKKLIHKSDLEILLIDTLM